MEYIRRKMAGREGDECRVFFSDAGECTAAKMNAWGADEIHANHLKALLQLFSNPFRSPKGKVVFTVHGIHLRKFDFLPKSPANRAKRFLRLSLERWLYAKCDRLIALTPTDAKDIARLYGTRLNIVIEPNTVAAGDFKPAPADLRFRRDEFDFACIARFDFQKGQDLLVKAIAAVQNPLRQAKKRFLLIGGGATSGEIRALANSSNVEDMITFAGEIPNAGVYMTCAKTLVAPSRWEGMPYLLLEAVARGRRVIASDCPGNRDVLDGYPNAALFPSNDVASLAGLLVAETSPSHTQSQ